MQQRNDGTDNRDDAATDAQGLDAGGLFWLAALARAGDRLVWRDYLYAAIGGILERNSGLEWAW